MKSLWNDADARDCVRSYGAEHGEDLAMRIYSARLLGSDPGLVLHGGGNVSVKTTARTLLGEDVEVLCVKASGFDLAKTSPAALPALESAPLRRLRGLSELSDLGMVGQLRRSMLDPLGPDASVETLLHAFLADKFVDHTHADAVLELTNQPDGEALVREALGDAVAVLPWVMPGLGLAQAVAEAREQMPSCEGVVVLNHGLFTFGPDARTSYERMIALVDRAERFVAGRVGGQPAMLVANDVPPVAQLEDRAAEAIPVVRGGIAAQAEGRLGPKWRRVVAAWRADPELAAFSMHPAAAEVATRGLLTPDHVIRTKGAYLHLSAEQAGDAELCRSAVGSFARDSVARYEAHCQRFGVEPEMADPGPRVVVVEGVGVVGFGDDARGAGIALDIAEHTLRSMARAEAVGRYQPLDAAGVSEMEYWSLEQAKVRREPKRLAGQVGLVTGAGGAIGHGIAEALLHAGCAVVLTDLDAARLETARGKLAALDPSTRVHAVPGDVTDADDVARIFRACCLAFGGVDIVVPNAGIAHVSSLAEMDPAAFRKVVEVNLTGTLLVMKEAAKVFAAQRTGGAVVVQSSKNVFDPGAGFGAYSASKAGVHQLGKIAALELAPVGVRVNMVNADAVFGDEAIKSGLWEEVGPDRMRARGLDPEGLKAYYRDRSLLKTSVLPAHVGEAVVFFASADTPTTGATLPVDGGIPGAFPR